MRRTIIWLCLSFLMMGFVSCSDDKNENELQGNDPTKLVVTGELKNEELGFSKRSDWDTSRWEYYDNRYTVEIYGYANLTKEISQLLALDGIYLGIEVADNEKFNNSKRFYTSSIDSDNKFSVKGWAEAGSTVYWRAFLSIEDFNEYGNVRSQKLPTVEAAMQNAKVETGNVINITETGVSISFSAYGGFWSSAKQAGIVYTTDRSILTQSTIKSKLTAADGEDVWTSGRLYSYSYSNYERYMAENNMVFERGDKSNMLLWDLSPGTTYYFCEYRYAKTASGLCVSIGDIREFTTNGYNITTLRNAMNISITPDDNRRQWTVRYSSSLERLYPNSTFRYRIITGYPIEIEDYYAVCANETNEYTESSYSGTIPYPTLIAFFPESTGGYAGGEVLINLYNKIASGKADDADRAEYAALLKKFGAYYPQSGDKDGYVIAVCVEVDDLLYPVERVTSSGGDYGKSAPHISVAEFIQKADTQIAYELTGIVQNITNTTYGNFDLVEGDASIFIYGLLDLEGKTKNFASLGISEGDKITLTGTYHLYNGNPEIKNAQLIRKEE